MDYFIVFLIIIIIFTFLSDKKVISIDKIKEQLDTIEKQVDDLYNKTLIVSISREEKNNREKTIERINNLVKNNTDKEYVILLNGVDVEADSIKILLANYINQEEKMCIFRTSYEYQYINHEKFKDIKNELKVVAINYINIFSKSYIDTEGVIILKLNEMQKLLDQQKTKKIIVFSPSEHLKILCSQNSTKHAISNIEENYYMDITAILKSILIIIVGVSVTANIINSIYNMDITSIITSGVIYWCYKFVLTYMYMPIGKYKFLAKYIFPIFLAGYLLVIVLNKTRKMLLRNKKVHAT